MISCRYCKEAHIPVSYRNADTITAPPAMYNAPPDLEASMAEILIEDDRAQRIIARILRENGFVPDSANTVANGICDNLRAAMYTPSKMGLQGWRIINSHPPFRDEPFYQDVKAHIAADSDGNFARELWRIVWNYGRDLPPDIAPPRNY